MPTDGRFITTRIYGGHRHPSMGHFPAFGQPAAPGFAKIYGIITCSRATKNIYPRKFYPAMKGSAEFFLDTLIEEPTHHWLVTSPSLSPENGHPQGRTSVCAGPTLDMEILRDLFANCIQASEILGVDKDFRSQKSPPPAPVSRHYRLARKGNFKNGWKTGMPSQARTRIIATFRISTGCIRVGKLIYALHPSSPRPSEKSLSNSAATRPPDGRRRGGLIYGLGFMMAITPTKSSSFS